ncbi:MAG: TonB family protein [Puniceicoccales bacterium]|nr:TonB family protein [Puniceicoccales bacterium]
MSDKHFTAPTETVVAAPAVEVIKVDLTSEADVEVATPRAREAANSLSLPLPDVAPPPLTNLPAPPTVTPVAVPAEVAFALPVEGPVAVVSPKEAAFAPPAKKLSEASPPDAAGSAAVPSSQFLVFGQGQGRQPSPVYPYQAIRHNWTGTVRVRLDVGIDGRVSTADAVVPCRWVVLNESAVSTVRRLWRFPPGPRRVYEVDIRFELQ